MVIYSIEPIQTSLNLFSFEHSLVPGTYENKVPGLEKFSYCFGTGNVQTIGVAIYSEVLFVEDAISNVDVDKENC